MADGNLFDSKLQGVSDRLERAQEEFDKSHEGTPPESVWPGSEPELCSDFIDFVKAQGFKGAVRLEAVREASEFSEMLGGTLSWSIRGYGIGVQRRDEPATSLPFDVFICEDKILRTWESGTDRFSTSVRRMSSVCQEVADISDRPVEQKTISPDSIGDPWGPPDIGHFVLVHVGAKCETVKNTYSYEGVDYWEPDTKREVVPAHTCIDFEGLELEFLLTAHATVAALGQGALNRRQAAALSRDRVNVEALDISSFRL